MITLKSDDLTENQLAQIALSIQNRWEVATFVKMHEIVVMDDEQYEDPAARSISRDFGRGMASILDFHELSDAFKIVQENRTKFRLVRKPDSKLPSWITNGPEQKKVPDGILECGHCGKWFTNDVEYSLHTKLHYII